MTNTRHILAKFIALGLLLLVSFNTQAQTCPGGLGTPIYINSFPYSGVGLTTCGNPNSIFHTTATLCSEVWNSYGKDQVFIFTPSVTDSVAIMLKTERTTATMTLYAGCPLLGQGGTCVANVTRENTANAPYVGMLLQITAGTTYYLVVDDGASPAQQCVPSYDLFILKQPENDDIGGAIALTPGNSCNPVTGNTYAASRTNPVPNECGGSVDDDVWYKFTATSTSHVITVDPVAPTANIDPVVDVRDGGYGGANIACSYLGDGFGVTEVIELNNLTVGHTYYVRVYTDDNVVEYRGYFTICVTTPAIAPPANNDCSGAVTLQAGAAPVTGTTVGATQSLPAISCNGTGNADDDVWYQFVTSDPSFIITASSATLDLVIDVRRPAGDCIGTNHACINSSGAGATESATITTVSGNPTYFIRVYSVGNTTGTFTISISTPTPPPACIASPTAPTNGQSGFCPGSTQTLSWASQSGATSYDLYFGTSATPPFVANLAATNYSTTALSAGTYYWQIGPKNAGGAASGCTVWSFTVADNTAPVITCPANVTVNANASCQATLATYAAASLSDNCGTPSVTQLPAAGSTLGSGVSTVTLRATDAAANSKTCTFSVTVSDQSAPTIACPANITVSSNASCQATLVAYTPVSVNDNCTASPMVIQLPAAGTTINGGINTITLRASDAAGNSSTCNFNVTITDAIAPTITCPANVTVAANASCQAVLSAYTAASVNDNCGTPSVLQTPAAGKTIAVGANTVALRATDASGNSASCTFSVTVADQTAPAISCPATATAIANASCQAILGTYSAASTSDNCSTPTVLQIPAAGATLPSGINTVTLRATDAAGNSASCTFNVTVVDQTAPVITCPANTTLAAGTSCQAALANYTALATASDNCTASPVKTQLPATGTIVGQGTTTVTLRASDAANNSASCTFNVIVSDQTAPVISCPANTTVAANAACSGAIGSYLAASLSDNCSANPTVTQSPAAGTALNGPNSALTVTLTANDGNGNSASCNFTVTLRDLTPPVARCKNATLNLAVNGSVTLATTLVNNTSTDNCSFSLTVTPATFGCGQIGNNIVTLRATDTGGNTATCTATVTVRDLMAPTALCKTINVYLDDEGHATITPAAVDNNSYDACGIASMTINNNEFDCGQLGGSPVPVQLTLRDVHNNTSSCMASVYVKDNLPPTPECENTSVELSASGYAIVTTSELASSSSDNCSVWSYSPTVKVFTTANIGINNVTINVKDYSNNAASCIAQVTVLPFGSGNKQNSNRGDADIEEEEPALQRGDEMLEVSVFPNPAVGISVVRFNLEGDQSYRLRLLDLNGRLVIDRNFQGHSGENTVALELDQLMPGIYLIDLQSGKMRGQQRVVVQR